MRKPDPAPDAQPRRSSAAAAPRSSVTSRASSSVADDANVTVKRKRSRPQLPVNEDSEDDGDDDDDDNDSNCHTDDNSHLRNKETNLVRHDPPCNIGEVECNIPSCLST